MKLSKLPLLLLTSFSLLASVTLLSCSNSTGSGGGTKPGNNDDPENTTGNIVATAIDSGIEVTAKNLSGKSRVDIYRIIEDTDLDAQWLYMTNFNNSDSVTVVDKYVNIGQSYTYVLAVDSWEQSNTVKATNGKGELTVDCDVTDDGIKINFGNINPSKNYYELSRYDLIHGEDFVDETDFDSSFNQSYYVDQFVNSGKKYEYKARIIVEGDRSGNVATTFAYARPVTVTASNGKGELDLGNTPAGDYNATEGKIIFTTSPVLAPDFLNTDETIKTAAVGFYRGGNGIGQWNRGTNYCSIWGEEGSEKIDGYCVIVQWKNGVHICSYKYDQGSNPKLSLMPVLTK